MIGRLFFGLSFQISCYLIRGFFDSLCILLCSFLGGFSGCLIGFCFSCCGFCFLSGGLLSLLFDSLFGLFCGFCKCFLSCNFGVALLLSFFSLFFYFLQLLFGCLFFCRKLLLLYLKLFSGLLFGCFLFLLGIDFICLILCLFLGLFGCL